MKYVSLLRGINVGGHKKILMAELRAMYAGLGLTAVQSYIQSGNVVFESSLRSGSRLAARIRQGIASDWGYDVPVVVRSHAELAAVVAECPFGEIDAGRDGSVVMVAFLSAVPLPGAVLALESQVEAPEEVVVRGREAYLRCPGGFGDSKLTITLLERRLGVDVTTRNWRTVLQLLAMSGPPPG